MEPKNTPHASFPKLLLTAFGLAHHLINFPRNAEAEGSLPANWAPVASKLPPTRDKTNVQLFISGLG